MKPKLDEFFTLIDDLEVHLRPIQPEDAAGLQRLHRRLSSDSVYQRFFSALKELPDAQAQRYAHVDFEDRVAIVAEAMLDDRCELLGVALYSVDHSLGEPAAELAIVVEDRFQNQGLGSRLLRRLVEIAHQKDIRRLRATVQPDNHPILAIIDRTPLPTQRSFEGGVWDIEIFLPDDLQSISSN